jgi:hypothetical protein
MRKFATALLAAAVCASALSAPALAAKKKASKAKKCTGEFMYVDKKSGKCMDARNKASAG